MAELDLLEKTRMQDVHRDINVIIDKITKLGVFPPLVWVWAWDVAMSIYTDIQEGGDPDLCVSKDEDEMWELFFTQADKNGFTLEYGAEDLYESIRDWMIDEEVVEYYNEEEDEDEDD